MRQGWIKKYRDIMTHWLWRDPIYYQIWDFLLFEAELGERKELYRGRLYTLHRGEVAATTTKIAKVCNTYRRKVSAFLEIAQEEGMISRAKCDTSCTTKFSVITICNYDKYQGVEDAVCNTPCDTNRITNCAQSVTQSVPVHIYKESKNIKNTIAEINFCSSETSSDTPPEDFDPQKFVAFFNAQMDGAGAAIPRARSLTGQRLAAVRARIREHGRMAVAEAVMRAARSDFLNGGGAEGWVADIGWIFRPNNFPKVLEGSFSDRRPGPRHKTSADIMRERDAEAYRRRMEEQAARERRIAERKANALTPEEVERFFAERGKAEKSP